MHTAGASTMTANRNNRGKMKRSRFAKAGRDRDALAARHPGGKKVQEPDHPQAIAMAQPHRHDLPTVPGRRGEPPRDLRLDPRAESQHGRYCIDGTITEQFYAAGVRYLEANARYRAAIAVPDSLARFTGSGGKGSDENTKRAVEAFNDANKAMKGRDPFDAAIMVLDRRAQYAVGQVVLRDMPIPLGYRACYSRGLMQLARHYGIGER